MTSRAMMNRTTATATTTPARMATRLHRARIDHGAVSEPERPFTNTRTGRCLANRYRLGVRPAPTLSLLASPWPVFPRIPQVGLLCSLSFPLFCASAPTLPLATLP